MIAQQALCFVKILLRQTNAQELNARTGVRVNNVLIVHVGIMSQRAKNGVTSASSIATIACEATFLRAIVTSKNEKKIKFKTDIM